MVSRTTSASLYDTGLPGPFRRRDGCAAFLQFPAFARTRLIRKTIPSQSEALTRLNHPLFHSLGPHCIRSSDFSAQDDVSHPDSDRELVSGAAWA